MIKLNTRVLTKHAKAAEWEVSDLIILDGELIIYDPDDSSPLPRFKVGNGTNTASQLPFIEPELFSKDYNDLSDRTKEIVKEKYKLILKIVLCEE